MIPQKVITLLVSFALLTLVFWAVEFFWPSVPNQKRFRRGFLLDTVYWFFTPLITKSASQVALLILLVPLFMLLGRSLDAATISAGYGPVLALPLWAQAVAIILLGDFIGYWTHRWFHGRRLWRFHAVHHSPEELDWLSSVRLHPVNDVVSRVFQTVPFVLIGFSPVVVAAYIPFLTFHAIFIHANLAWSFGPLRYIFSSPEFHRWHHTSEEEGLDKNFAGLLPLWDLIFGTFYMPEGKHPTKFGITGDPMPESLWGQMMYPWRKPRAEGVRVSAQP